MRWFALLALVVLAAFGCGGSDTQEPEVTGTIAFTRGDDVWLMRADGSRQRRLTRGNDPSWSPDGRRIALLGLRKRVVADLGHRRQRPRSAQVDHGRANVRHALLARVVTRREDHRVPGLQRRQLLDQRRRGERQWSARALAERRAVCGCRRRVVPRRTDDHVHERRQRGFRHEAGWKRPARGGKSRRRGR